MTAYETLLVEVSDRVAVITLDRAEVRNAINARSRPTCGPRSTISVPTARSVPWC